MALERPAIKHFSPKLAISDKNRDFLLKDGAKMNKVIDELLFRCVLASLYEGVSVGWVVCWSVRR